jgi:hypothetical protein
MSHATGPSATEITVRETLNLLDERFAAFAEDIAQDRYVLWLGSGISRGRVDDLKRLVRRVLSYLQERIDHSVKNCRFRRALDEVLSLVPPTERKCLDFKRPVGEWEELGTILEYLRPNYSKLLDVSVEGEPLDFLLWEAVDVRGTYANDTVTPDCEHLCVAILVTEGVFSDIASANWDGLIEAAMEQIGGASKSIISVCVTGKDFREPSSRTRLFKFHGCAVRAKTDPGTYRNLLIARHSQINDWISNSTHAVMVNHLIDLVVRKPTLIVGLSVQDANIQNVFASAKNRMKWRWSSNPHAYVFAEDDLGADQKSLLRCVYCDDYETAASPQEIDNSARLPAYAKPLLVALVLHVLCTKLRRLVELAVSRLTAGDCDKLKAGVIALRNFVAACVEPDHLAFIRLLVRHMSCALSLFQEGKILPPAVLHYCPLSVSPVHQIEDEPSLSTSGLRELAIALALLGIGMQNGAWTPDIVDPSDSTAGALRVVSSTSGPTGIFFVANSTAEIQLYRNDYISDGNTAVLVHSTLLAPSMPRSPRATPGRTGHVGSRAVSIAELLESVSSTDQLFQKFREEVAL